MKREGIVAFYPLLIIFLIAISFSFIYLRLGEKDKFRTANSEQKDSQEINKDVDKVEAPKDGCGDRIGDVTFTVPTNWTRSKMDTCDDLTLYSSISGLEDYAAIWIRRIPYKTGSNFYDFNTC